MPTSPLSSLPRIPLAVLRRTLPAAERDEILADIAAEFAARAAGHGRASARRWLWRQALESVPALLRWTTWRGATGWEPPANAYRPGGAMLKYIFGDARYATRRLRARPGYTAIAVATLALGIGGTAAIFGIARPLLFDPLPYANADRDAMFWMGGWWTEKEYMSMRGLFSGFDDVAAYRPTDVTMRVGDAAARLVPGITLSANTFDVLGVHTYLGRGFRPGDDIIGAEPVAVVSYGLWKELGGNQGVVGQRVNLGGTQRTIVGVMPPGFWFPDPAIRVWLAGPLDPKRQNGSFSLIGLMPPGQDIRGMDAHVQQVTRALGERFHYSADADKTKNARLTSLRDEFLGRMRPAVVATFVAMALILLIACVNVAALMLGQVEGRSTELAVRTALGASRARLLQQLVIEAVLLGIIAAAVGAGLAAVGSRVLADALPIGAWAERAHFDWTMFLVALAVAIVAVLLVVLAPAVSLWRGDLRDVIGSARMGGLHGRGGRLERSLIVVEVAIAMLIASGAALLVRSVANRYAIDPGIDVKGVAVADIMGSSSSTLDQRRLGVDAIMEGVRALPGVHDVGAALKIPLRGGGDNFDITIEGHPELPETYTFFRIVSVDYFRTMGVHVVAGRAFDASDDPNGRFNVVINEALARKYFPGENPIGRRVGGGFDTPATIIGVVNDVAEGELKADPQPARYYDVRQTGWFGPNATIVARTTRPQDAERILDDMRRVVQRVAPSYAVQDVTTLQHIFDTAVGPARQVMSLLTLLSALALGLGAVGIYGVIAHFAARRKRDWAIRVALGLPGSGVVKQVVSHGVMLALAGILLGAVSAAALTRLLASLLYGVSAVDPVAFGAASLALVAIGAAAAFFPAWRAGHVDPALVLREE